MASPVLRAGSSRSFAVPSLRNTGLNYGSQPGPFPSARGLTALSVEFVAKPEKARSAPVSLPGAINGALREVSGFAGCLVMVADQEARLITVVTFWEGDEAQKCCQRNSKWVQALLAAYVDRCLRVKTMFAHLPAMPLDGAEANAAEASFLIDETETQEENACVA